MKSKEIRIGQKTKAIIEETVDAWAEKETSKKTPKGEPRPFSRDKMRVVCYVAIGIPAKNISDLVGVPNGTIRTWKSEQRFKFVVATVWEYLLTKNIERRRGDRRVKKQRRRLEFFGR